VCVCSSHTTTCTAWGASPARRMQASETGAGRVLGVISVARWWGPVIGRKSTHPQGGGLPPPGGHDQGSGRYPRAHLQRAEAVQALQLFVPANYDVILNLGQGLGRLGRGGPAGPRGLFGPGSQRRHQDGGGPAARGRRMQPRRRKERWARSESRAVPAHARAAAARAPAIINVCCLRAHRRAGAAARQRTRAGPAAAPVSGPARAHARPGP
jgi:hypothetical protein